MHYENSNQIGSLELLKALDIIDVERDAFLDILMPSKRVF